MLLALHLLPGQFVCDERQFLGGVPVSLHCYLSVSGSCLAMTHRVLSLQPLKNQARFLVDLDTFPHGPEMEGGKGSTAAGHLVRTALKRLTGGLQANRDASFPVFSIQRFSTVPFFLVGRSDS